MTGRVRGAAVAALFLASTATYATGNALLADDLVAGALLTGATGPLVLAIGVLLRPVLAVRTPGAAAGYLGLRAAECVVLVAVAASWLLGATPGAARDLPVYAATALAGLVLCRALLLGRLLPRPIAVVGVVGYAALLAGTVLHLAGVVDLGAPTGAVFYLPGAVFEVVFPVWLLVRGLASRAVAPGRPVVATARWSARTGGSTAG